jgi:hypothetical protein
VDAVKRVGEVGHGICGGDGAGAGAEGCYRPSMGDDWRVGIAFGAVPRSLHSFRRALISALGSRLGDQVAVSSRRWGTQIFVYAPSIGSADEAAQVAREVLARHDVSAPVRTERWSPREQKWRDADEMSADVAAERQALHEARQELERQASVTSGRPRGRCGSNCRHTTMWCGWPGILPPRDGGSARTAGTSSSGRTAKTTLRAWPGSSPVTAALTRIRPSGSGGLIYIHPGLTVAPLQAACLDPGRLRVLRPALRARGPGINMAARKKHTLEQVVRKLATADREPPPRTYTTWTAVTLDLVFTVLTYGPSPLYRPPSVRNLSSPGQQTSRSPRRAIGYARILSQVRCQMPSGVAMRTRRCESERPLASVFPCQLVKFVQ